MSSTPSNPAPEDDDPASVDSAEDALAANEALARMTAKEAADLWARDIAKYVDLDWKAKHVRTQPFT